MKYSAARTKVICKVLSEGRSIAEACSKADISIATYYAWLEEHQTFSEATTRARDEGEAFLAGLQYENALEKPEELRWRLERQFRSRWSSKVEVEHSGSTNAPLTIQHVFPEHASNDRVK